MSKSYLYDKYYVTPILGLTGCWSVIVICMIGLLSDGNKDILHFGPGENKFIHLKIDNWGRWSFVMLYSFFSQLVNSLINSTIYPFITNVIRDYKSPYDGSVSYAQFIAVIYKLYYWFNEICDLFLVLTLQVQYWIPGLIADILVALWSTNRYLKEKKLNGIYNEIQQDSSQNKKLKDTEIIEDEEITEDTLLSSLNSNFENINDYLL